MQGDNPVGESIDDIQFAAHRLHDPAQGRSGDRRSGLGHILMERFLQLLGD